MIAFIIILFYLILCTYTDIAYMKIYVMPSAFFAAAGLLLHALSYTNHAGISDMALSIAAGIAAVFLSFLTRGSVGLGDGIMLIVLGFYLPAAVNLGILLYALILSALFSLLLIAARHLSGKHRLPFAPFLLSGYIIHYTLFFFFE